MPIKKLLKYIINKQLKIFLGFLKKNENIRNKVGLLLTFLCGSIGFCVTLYFKNNLSYFLVLAILYYLLSLIVCFKLFLTKTTICPFFPVQEKRDQKQFYTKKQNGDLTTIIEYYTRPAIEKEKQLNDKLSTNFDRAVKATILMPLVAIILIIFYYHYFFLYQIMKLMLVQMFRYLFVPSDLFVLSTMSLLLE